MSSSSDAVRVLTVRPHVIVSRADHQYTKNAAKSGKRQVKQAARAIVMELVGTTVDSSKSQTAASPPQVSSSGYDTGSSSAASVGFAFSPPTADASCSLPRSTQSPAPETASRRASLSTAPFADSGYDGDISELTTDAERRTAQSPEPSLQSQAVPCACATASVAAATAATAAAAAEADTAVCKKRRRRRTRRRQQEGEMAADGEEEADAAAGRECADEGLEKYWSQRYRLFSRFDDGVMLDAEGWYSVSPECIAKHLAERCACGVIVDGFCGVGGNTIHFASTCGHVIAVDLDPAKVEMARHNCEVYGVANNVDFIVGDFRKVIPTLKGVDAVFLSPPWGGPDYISSEVFDLHRMRPDGIELFHMAKQLSPNVAYFLPRNADLQQLLSLGEDTVEIEQHYINDKLKAVTAFFGNLKIQQ
eukprot:TRINITY_DN17569_c0_g1_i1.p1 TRINITY_DN17569_c0_g1~~TRINITY_DN17569_c0_g1_i1.p1  ORF type:complete len:420 (+),score=134.12 TRINITY_DN17569_c0_g1_i1:69-1328(+)